MLLCIARAAEYNDDHQAPLCHSYELRQVFLDGQAFDRSIDDRHKCIGSNAKILTLQLVNLKRFR